MDKKRCVLSGSHGGEDTEVGVPGCGIVGRYQGFRETYCLHDKAKLLFGVQ